MKYHSQLFPELKYGCLARGCGRVGAHGFDRLDNMREHLLNYHGWDTRKRRAAKGKGPNRSQRQPNALKSLGRLAESQSKVVKPAINHSDHQNAHAMKGLSGANERIAGELTETSLRALQKNHLKISGLNSQPDNEWSSKSGSIVTDAFLENSPTETPRTNVSQVLTRSISDHYSNPERHASCGTKITLSDEDTVNEESSHKNMRAQSPGWLTRDWIARLRGQQFQSTVTTEITSTDPLGNTEREGASYNMGQR